MIVLDRVNGYVSDELFIQLKTGMFIYFYIKVSVVNNKVTKLGPVFYYLLTR